MSTQAREGYLARATDEDDVEGHAMPTREGFVRSRETDEDDVEGHSMQAHEDYGPTPGEGFLARATEDEDDVEGHGFSLSTRGE